MDNFTSSRSESKRSREDMVGGNPLRYGRGPKGEALQVNPSSTMNSITNATWKSGNRHARVVVNTNILGLNEV